MTSSSTVSIVLYVDDLLVTGSSEVGNSKTKAFLMTKFAIKNLGDVSLIFGMQVSRDRLKGTLDMNQGNYVNAILQRHGFVDSRSVWKKIQPTIHRKKHPDGRYNTCLLYTSDAADE